MAVVDYFLKIEGIQGESTDSKHKGEIELTSFSWGVTNSTSHAIGSGAGSGKVSFQDFQFTAASSKASPQLLANSVKGTRVNTAVLTARKAGERPVEFLKITMTNVLVSFYKEQGPSTEVAPADEVGLLFQKLTFEFSSQTPTGELTAPTSATVENAAIREG
jgi:type VI secretion system secreted protein Hcp